MIYLDFETEEIQARPEYPPTPVGYSILINGEAKYLAWGHPVGNNTTFKAAKQFLQDVWDTGQEIVMHNAPFDLEVAHQKMGMPLLPWNRVHCTQILAFLNNPHAKSLALKDLAEELCGIPPTERDELREWILANVPKSTKAKFGKHISKAPGDLVGRYADSDTKMTAALFKVLLDNITKNGMTEAYNRERKLMPILMQNSREGIPVDVPKLGEDLIVYREALAELDTWILDRLGITNPEFNLDSDAEMANAMEAKGLVKEWVLTEKGARSTSAEALEQSLLDKDLLRALQYRGPFVTCINTFMQNWYDTGLRSGGNIYVGWNSTRGEGIGARTGRLSSQPNVQNIPTNFSKVNEERFDWLPELPRVREYIKAPDGYILLGRDYSAQEVRVFAHYEDAEIANMYRLKADADVHQFIADMVTASGVPILRRQAKTILFLTFYGGGAANLAAQLGVELEEAKKLKNAFLKVFPALKELNADMKTRARMGLPIRTLGGRVYYCEPPKEVNGQLRTFDYKMINVLIQGSSADQSKQAIIDWHVKTLGARLILSVHDEMVVMCKKSDMVEEMQILKDAMENAIPLDVPVLSSGEVGTNWYNGEPYNDK